MAEAAVLSPPDIRRAARRGLVVFFAIVVVLSGSIEAYWIMNPTMVILVFPLMWSPAVASVIARLVLREGFSDVSFRFGGRRTLAWIALGLILPTVVGTLAYGIALLTGLVGFDPQPDKFVARFVGDSASPVTVFVVWLALATTIGTVFGCLQTAGEEIGWRGYMLTRLIDAGVPRPVLASGLIWGLWHCPLILAGIYAAGPTPALSVVLFMGSITSFGYVVARMRLETGSIWPPIVAHSAWNAIIQGPFDGAATGPNAALWTGESGIITVMVAVVVAVLVSRGSWTYIRSLPGRGVPLSQQLSQHSPRVA
jgi:membrane protease YdiL (CAAX protease family)